MAMNQGMAQVQRVPGVSSGAPGSPDMMQIRKRINGMAPGPQRDQLVKRYLNAQQTYKRKMAAKKKKTGASKSKVVMHQGKKIYAPKKAR